MSTDEYSQDLPEELEYLQQHHHQQQQHQQQQQQQHHHHRNTPSVSSQQPLSPYANLGSSSSCSLSLPSNMDSNMGHMIGAEDANQSSGAMHSSAASGAAGLALGLDSVPRQKRKYTRRKQPEERKKRGPRTKDLNAPRMPLNGYVRFLNANRERIKHENPDLSFAEVTKKLASEWSAMSSDDKKAYLEEAEKAKEMYLKELHEYQKTESYQEFLSMKQRAKHQQQQQQQQQQQHQHQQQQQQQQQHQQHHHRHHNNHHQQHPLSSSPMLSPSMSHSHSSQSSPIPAMPSTASAAVASGACGQQANMYAGRSQQFFTDSISNSSMQRVGHYPHQLQHQQPQQQSMYHHQQQQQQQQTPYSYGMNGKYSSSSSMSPYGHQSSLQQQQHQHHQQQQYYPSSSSHLSSSTDYGHMAGSNNHNQFQNRFHPSSSSFTNPINGIGSPHFGTAPMNNIDLNEQMYGSGAFGSVAVGGGHVSGAGNGNSLIAALEKCDSPIIDLPIYTEEFLEHNKMREQELRNYRALTMEYEEENAILSKHVDDMTNATERLMQEETRERETNGRLRAMIEKLQQNFVENFQDIDLPAEYWPSSQACGGDSGGGGGGDGSSSSCVEPFSSDQSTNPIAGNDRTGDNSAYRVNLDNIDQFMLGLDNFAQTLSSSGVASGGAGGTCSGAGAGIVGSGGGATDTTFVGGCKSDQLVQSIQSAIAALDEVTY